MRSRKGTNGTAIVILCSPQTLFLNYATLLTFVLLSLGVNPVASVGSCGPTNSTQGSTPQLKEIVLGRCNYYKHFKLPAARAVTVNCTAVWGALYNAFAFKDPCSLTFSDYEPYFRAVGGGEIVNKSMFWSGTYKAVHSYSDFDIRYSTLEDTMAGWLVNSLMWCGNESLSRNTTDGIDYTSCPLASPQCDYMTAFWGLASRKFAERARGRVRVMVNGSRVACDGTWIPAYKNQSYFGMYELPALNSSAITELQIIVMHSIAYQAPEIESCGNGTVKQLQEDAKRFGLKVTCFDDPSAVKHVLCIDHPKEKVCQFASGGKKPPAKDCGPWFYVTIGLIIASSVLLLVTLILAIVVCRWAPIVRRLAEVC